MSTGLFLTKWCSKLFSPRLLHSLKRAVNSPKVYNACSVVGSSCSGLVDKWINKMRDNIVQLNGPWNKGKRMGQVQEGEPALFVELMCQSDGEGALYSLESSGFSSP